MLSIYSIQLEIAGIKNGLSCRFRPAGRGTFAKSIHGPRPTGQPADVPIRSRQISLCSARKKYPKERRTRRLAHPVICDERPGSLPFPPAWALAGLAGFAAPVGWQIQLDMAARSIPTWLRCSAAPDGNILNSLAPGALFPLWLFFAAPNLFARQVFFSPLHQVFSFE
jgi:hypothetical protein